MSVGTASVRDGVPCSEGWDWRSLQPNHTRRRPVLPMYLIVA
jgi:hypothetical protein